MEKKESRVKSKDLDEIKEKVVKQEVQEEEPFHTHHMMTQETKIEYLERPPLVPQVLIKSESEKEEVTIILI